MTSDETGLDAIKAAREEGLTLGEYRKKSGPQANIAPKKVTQAECAQMRSRVENGHPAEQVARFFGYAGSTCRHHITGGCEHTTDHPALTYDATTKAWIVKD